MRENFLFLSSLRGLRAVSVSDFHKSLCPHTGIVKNQPTSLRSLQRKGDGNVTAREEATQPSGREKSSLLLSESRAVSQAKDGSDRV
jgi:hypothetical protein